MARCHKLQGSPTVIDVVVDHPVDKTADATTDPVGAHDHIGGDGETVRGANYDMFVAFLDRFDAGRCPDRPPIFQTT